MILSILKNPFFLYAISFFLVMCLYFFGWSELFPSLSLEVVLFFVVTGLISVFIGFFVTKYKPVKYVKIQSEKSRYVLIGIYICYIISFVYNKGVPLVLILTKSGFFYKDYGIPFFQPFITTFTSFYTVFIFHVYLSRRNRKNLTNLILILIIPILTYNRGMLLISLVSFIIVFFISKKRIKIKTYFFFNGYKFSSTLFFWRFRQL